MIEEEVLLKYQDFWDFINTLEFPLLTNKEKEVKAIAKEKEICFISDGKKFAYIDNKEDLQEKIKYFFELGHKDINFNEIPISILVKMETKPLTYLKYLYNFNDNSNTIALNTVQTSLFSFF
jgi:hypothetical protein